MALTSEQVEELQSAILDAYDQPELTRLVRVHLQVDLRNLVPTESAFAGVVFELIGALQRRGVLHRLIVAMENDRPENIAVRDFIDRHGKAVGTPAVPARRGPEGAAGR